jgi:hypothetical protein
MVQLGGLEPPTFGATILGNVTVVNFSSFPELPELSNIALKSVGPYYS